MKIEIDTHVDSYELWLKGKNLIEQAYLEPVSTEPLVVKSGGKKEGTFLMGRCKR